MFYCLKIHGVIDGKPEEAMSKADWEKFEEAYNFLGGVILADRLCDVYIDITYVKELWDPFNTKLNA
jgi:hypothetical protein